MTDHEVAGAPSGGTTSEDTRRNGWGGERRVPLFFMKPLLLRHSLHSWSTIDQVIIVDGHAKLKPILKTKQSSQPRTTSPTCVSRVTWDEMRTNTHPTKNPTKMRQIRIMQGVPQKDHAKGQLMNPTKTIGPRDPMSEGSHKHTECNLWKPAIG